MRIASCLWSLIIVGASTHGTAGAQCINYGDYIHLSHVVTTPSIAGTMAVADSRGYLAVGSSGLQVFDLTNPGQPTLMGMVDTPGWAFDAVVAGHSVYLATDDFGLQVIDVADPAAPVVGGRPSGGRSAGITLDGTNA